MKELAPNYYGDFRCIADKCRHSCCVGWEIDIDEDSLEYYRSLSGELGRRLAQSIGENEEGAHFCLDENERCPFLNERGLCDIYTALGEDALCQICTDHPRFRNYFSSRTEIGVGLCCEAAAELILGQSEPFSLITLWEDGEDEEDDDFENHLFACRDKLFSLIRSAERAEAAAEAICPEGSTFLEKSDWTAILLDLERLDLKWEGVLYDLSRAPKTVWEAEMPQLDSALRSLLCYFIYRHFSASESTEDMERRLGFVYLSYRVLRALCAAREMREGSCTLADLCELARMYSSEIEYSIDNTEKLLNLWGG